MAELDGTANVVSRFVYATGINVPDYMVRGDSTYRLIRDHLGSVRLVVNVQSGTIAQQIAYDEFGVETQNTNPGFQPFGFAGGLTEVQTGLVRFGVRDYLPEAGRWTAKDPIRFGGGQLNHYAYAFSDPVNSMDPSGMVVPLLLAPAIVGGVASGTFTFLISLMNGDDAGTAAKNAAIAAATGFVAGLAPMGPLGAAFFGALAAGGTEVISQAIAIHQGRQETFSVCSAFLAAGFGALGGFAGNIAGNALGSPGTGAFVGGVLSGNSEMIVRAFGVGATPPQLAR